MNVNISTATTAQDLEAILPLIAAYQRFYAAEPDDDRNRAFFARFLGTDSLHGRLLVARRGDTPDPIGHACLYWHHSSVSAEDVVLLNDLFVTEQARGTGAGRALIEAAAQVARDRGVRRLTWSTAPDNATAQRLYDATGAERSTWVEYDLTV